MSAPTANPFTITKSVDFSDNEIFDFWVDYSEIGGLWEKGDPTSPMPMLILGGKGSGKTHLMRYFSFGLQRLRHATDVVGGLKSEGYIGIYLRCGGLNSARFRGKGLSQDIWSEAFQYYMELWLSQLALRTLLDAFQGHPELTSHEAAVISEISKLFDDLIQPPLNTVEELLEHLLNLQREVDSAVNNCSIKGCLDFRITVTRGRLIFGIPRVLASHLPSIRDCLFVYLIDEFENLSREQQKYINTLIREKESPCTFKIGSRLYGVRTFNTYSGDEENKEGSEYSAIRLDEFLRSNDEKYRQFAKKLILKRLKQHGVGASGPHDQQDDPVNFLSSFLEEPATDRLGVDETSFIPSKRQGKDRPYFRMLKQKLDEGFSRGLTPGLSTQEQIDDIIDMLICPPYPLLEKFNIFLLYKLWYANKDLLESAKSIQEQCSEYIKEDGGTSSYRTQIQHFKSDMLAQLRRDCDQKQIYAGLDKLIDMSWGLPRNLLVILKQVYAWALFYGEDPFRGIPISIKAQQAGVDEASNWFYRDAQMIGKDGKLVQEGINRLGTIFRRIRFSDKPAECSVTAFSADLSQSSAESQRIIEISQKWSILVKVGLQRERNTGRLDEKLQLNRMLTPRWDLPIYRRGVISLQPTEVNAIFDKEQEAEFDSILEDRVARMTAPSFGKGPAAKSVNENQFSLPFK